VGPRTGLDDVERRKIFPYRDSNFDSSAVQHVASRYTDSLRKITFPFSDSVVSNMMK
jgi:hypothetical protein